MPIEVRWALALLLRRSLVFRRQIGLRKQNGSDRWHLRLEF